MGVTRNRRLTAAELHENVPPDWYYCSIRRNLLQRYWHHRRFKEVSAVIEPCEKVLDIGSADGVFTNVILKKTRAGKTVGLDVLLSSVSWANKHWSKNKKLKFVVGDAHRLPFKSKEFDAVFAMEVLEHVFNIKKVIQEIKRVLKKGGYCVFLVPTDSRLFLSVWWFVKKFWWAKIWEDTHVQSFKKDSLSRLTREANLSIEIDKKFLFGMLQLIKARKG